MPLTPERRAEIEARIEEWRHRDEIYAGTAREVVQELLWVIDRMNEIRTSRSELAATTIAGLEVENARLRAERDTLRTALHYREGKAEVGRLDSDA
jgi:hypothetical protein